MKPQQPLNKNTASLYAKYLMESLDFEFMSTMVPVEIMREIYLTIENCTFNSNNGCKWLNNINTLLMRHLSEKQYKETFNDLIK